MTGAIAVFGIVFWAIVDAIERHHDAWLVLESLALAAFTFTLWRSTNRLWRTSERHANHMERSVAVAEAAAKAAIAASRAAEASAQAAITQADIARKTFILVHRPRIIVVELEMGGNHARRREWITEGKPVYLRLHIKNVGETTAQFGLSYYRVFWDFEPPRSSHVLGMKTISEYPEGRNLEPGHHKYIELVSGEIIGLELMSCAHSLATIDCLRSEN